MAQGVGTYQIATVCSYRIQELEAEGYRLQAEASIVNSKSSLGYSGGLIATT